MQLLRDLVHQRGLTLVVVTHDNRIFRYADRILHLEDGELTHEWTADEPVTASVHDSVVTRGLPAGRLRLLKECVS
jgi:putative ABC transport system ATP-binding protein